MRRIHPLLLVLALLLIGAAGPVGTQRDGLPDGLGLRLLDVPVDRADDPRANAYIVDHAIPGSVVRRSIEVSNGTDTELPVELFGVPATATDEWLIGTGETGPAELASWIVVEPASLVLAPQSVVVAEVTIAIPSGIAEGERYAAVVAQPPAMTGSDGVSLVNRVAIRAYLSVGAGAEPVPDFAIDTLTARRDPDGVPVVDVGILNTGELAVDVVGELLLQSEDGIVTAGPFPAVLPSTLGPGNTGAVVVPLTDDIAGGPWVITATMRSGLLERAAQATVTFPDSAGEVADPVVAQRIEAQRRVLIPLAGTMIIVALAIIAWLLRAARRESEDEDSHDGEAASV